MLIASLVHRYEFALPSPGWDPTIRETTDLSPGPMPLKTWRRGGLRREIRVMIFGLSSTKLRDQLFLTIEQEIEQTSNHCSERCVLFQTQSQPDVASHA